MGFLMNTAEIDIACDNPSIQRHPVYGPAAEYLAAYRDLVDGVSDGWAYWKAATSAALPLQKIVYHGYCEARGYGDSDLAKKPTIQDVASAVKRIKSFMVRTDLFEGVTPPVLDVDATIKRIDIGF